VPSSDRITLPGDLRELAAESCRDLEPPASAVRELVPLRAVPWLIVTYDALRAMNLDPRDGFLISLVDGRLTVEAILDIAGFPERDTLAIVAKLLELGVLELQDDKVTRLAVSAP
jgi:hypothetical protein